MIIPIKSITGTKPSIFPTIHHPNHYCSYLSSDEKLISILKSCQKTSQVSQVHCSLIKTGLHLDHFKVSKLLASTALVDTHYAYTIFKYIKNPNVFMYSTMLRGYSIGDNPTQALVLFNHMRAHNVVLDQFCYVSTLKSCARLCADWFGRGVHSVISRSGFDLALNLKNALMRFYCVCGNVESAHRLFDEIPQRRDMISWNTLLGGYLSSSKPVMVLELFRELFREEMRVDASTVLSVFSALGILRIVSGGESLHAYCIKTGLELDSKVASALITMYAKFDSIDSGRRVFDEAPNKDVVLWNCLIDMYTKSGQLKESLSLIESMRATEVKPNSLTFTALLSVCASSGALVIGQNVDEYVKEEGLVLDAVLGTALVDMYCKLGLLQRAIDVFNRMRTKDVESWTTMILGFGVNGQAENALKYFQMMKNEKIHPNGVTFLVVLSACSHGGLVNEGIDCFESMVRDYNLVPKVEHYGCVIDLLGRAGLLEEAYRLIKSMPMEGDVTAWRTLLAACRVYGSVKLGIRVKRILNETFGEHLADEIVLSGAYAVVGTTQIGSDYDNVAYGVKETGLSMIVLEGQA